MGHLGIIAVPTANARDYSVSFCLAWSWLGLPSMPSQLEAKAPLQFCMGGLPALEVFLSNAMLSPTSGFWYHSTSVVPPPLTVWMDLAKYLRSWHLFHSLITAIYYLKYTGDW